MLFKLALASLSCLAVEACTANVELNSSEQLFTNDAVPDVQWTVDPVTVKKRQQWQAFRQTSSIENKQLTAHNELLKAKISPKTSYMALMPTGSVNALGNPLYELRLYANNQLLGVYAAVTGRAYTQTRNRHVAGTQAPLPDGKYTVNRSTIPGTNPEVGGRFLPIQPMFQTGRSALGIHFDPSFEKSRTEDGTEGCIALTNKRDLDQVLNYVRTYHPQYLEVNIQP